LGNVVLEGSIDGAIEDGKLSMGDLKTEAIFRSIFDVGGKFISKSAGSNIDEIQKLVDVKKSKTNIKKSAQKALDTFKKAFPDAAEQSKFKADDI